jgi:hypothetical protein
MSKSFLVLFYKKELLSCFPTHSSFPTAPGAAESGRKSKTGASGQFSR